MFFSKLFLMLLAASVSAPALAQNPENADGVAKAILAQTQVTEKNLRNMADAMGNLKGTPYDDPDYAVLSQEYLMSVNRAMEAFDQGMRNNILPKAQRWLNRYVAAYKQSDNKDFRESIVKDTQVQLQQVSKEYHDLVGSIFEMVLGKLPALIFTQNLEATAELCGHFAPGSKQTKRGLEYQGAYHHNAAAARGLVIEDWKGHTTSLTRPISCLVTVPVYYKGGGYSGSYYYFYKNGALVKGPLNSDQISSAGGFYAWDVNNASGFYSEEGIHRWFAGGEIVTAYEVNPIPFVIDAIKTQWLSRCHSTTCRQLRLADLTQFLTVANMALLNPVDFEFPEAPAQSNYGNKQYLFSLAAPNIHTTELLFVARQLVPRVENLK